VATPPQVNTPATGVSQIVSNWNNKCVDVPNGLYSDRVRLTVSDCWGGPMQKFQFAADGTIRIGGKCVDVADGSTASGAAVQLWSCNNSAAQKWTMSAAGDVVNPQADKCLDIAGWNGNNGAVLQTWQCVGSANQKWRRA
jgi:hypothetical protein